MRYLLAIGIGPVQDFIAAARRCRDLWFGSRMLSDVSRAVAKHLSQHGAELVFPAPESPGDLDRSSFIVANKLLAIATTDNIRAFSARAQKAAEDSFASASDLQKLRPRLLGTTINEGFYGSQLRDFLEYYSAWVPLPNDDQYQSARARAEELLASRKVLRSFPWFKGEAGEPKSSLDGVRENVIKKRSPRLFESTLHEDEYLDAIGVVKRFSGRPAPFDSTVDVAAVPYEIGRRHNQGDAMTLYDAFVRNHDVPTGTLSLLYPHESRQLFKRNEAAHKELEDIRRLLKEPQPPYYAMLLGDGDRMGKAIGEMKRAEEHRDFSLKLTEFASEAAKLIDSKEYRGCAIYCGGDDVLALLPLHKALECAIAVNGLFATKMGKFGVTFSAGLVVAHGLEPLSEVRSWAKDAEGKAKGEAGRNAICIAAYPRSGAPVDCHFKWDEAASLAVKIVNLYTDKKAKFSLGFAHELRELAERTARWSELDSSLRDLAVTIAKKKECSDPAIELVKQHSTDRASLERLYRTMLVVRPFARAKKEAEGSNGENTPH